ncbi:MAG: WD40 repeat domain-containing protein [Planctomycetia bacterium]|nr:WD40 repeat domain-containing protein [Planctomycetia bacterium]
MKQALYPLIIAWTCVVAVPGLSAHEIQPRLKFKAHTGMTRTVLITSDDKSLITLGGERLENDGKLVGDTTVKVWDLSTGKQREFPQFAGQAIALSPEGKCLAVIDNHSVRLVDLLTGKVVSTFSESKFPLRSVAFSPDGKTLAIGWSNDGPKPGSKLGVAQIWDLATSKPIATLEPNRGPMRTLAFSSDGKLLAVATQTFPSIGDVRFWDVSSGKLHSTLEAGGVDCLAFSPDGKTLAAGCGGRLVRIKKDTPHHVRLWDVEAASNLQFIRYEFRVLCIAFSPDGTTVAAGSEGGELALWNKATGRLRCDVPDQRGYVLSVAFTRDGKTLVSTNSEGEVRCWDVAKLPKGNSGN